MASRPINTSASSYKNNSVANVMSVVQYKLQGPDRFGIGQR